MVTKTAVPENVDQGHELVSVRIDITGLMPVIMQNGRMADPLNEHAQKLAAVSGKKNKTNAEHERMADIEWEGCLYYDHDFGPYIPGENLWRAVYDAAKSERLGESVKSGFLVSTPLMRLEYRGPRDFESLQSDANFRIRHWVNVNGKHPIRTRPIFTGWQLTAEAAYLDSLFDIETIRRIMRRAGTLKGLGTWRPRYGTFDATVTAL